ncbi:nicotinamide riboside transporter PnuC [Parapedobacter tibetensis]|uniref:nicotinamide riboside transporter PnuC n=1 Tax=Parapedobacter tibetensis TaxID=2972951 RepID=UPI00214DB722|nr:nicotinamide riboside transporter PnuC [Parapedobacter tibetensis]
MDVSFFELLVDQFRQTSALEWFGTITGFVCVYLAARQHILNWPISILSVSAYAILFYQSKLYGDAALQFYFLGTAIYGWYYWAKRDTQDMKPIVSLSTKQITGVVALTTVLAFLLGLFLSHFTDTDVPFIDGTCTALSFVAQFLMSRKVLQNWLLWIIVDICYIPLYVYKGLTLTAVLYLAFAIIAYTGYRDWRKTWIASN